MQRSEVTQTPESRASSAQNSAMWLYNQDDSTGKGGHPEGLTPTMTSGSQLRCDPARLGRFRTNTKSERTSLERQSTNRSMGSTDFDLDLDSNLAAWLDLLVLKLCRDLTLDLTLVSTWKMTWLDLYSHLILLTWNECITDRPKTEKELNNYENNNYGEISNSVIKTKHDKKWQTEESTTMVRTTTYNNRDNNGRNKNNDNSHLIQQLTIMQKKAMFKTKGRQRVRRQGQKQRSIRKIRIIRQIVVKNDEIVRWQRQQCKNVVCL